MAKTSVQGKTVSPMSHLFILVGYLEAFDVGQCVRLQDLLHVWLRMHQHERKLGAQLTPDGAKEKLHLSFSN